MHFSENSRTFMNFFLNDVDNYLKKHNPKQQRQQDIIIKKLYTDMYNSDTFIKLLMKQKRFKKQQKIIGENIKVPAPSLLTSNYVPDVIKRYIEENSKAYMHYTCRMFNRSISIYIVVFHRITMGNVILYDKMVHQMLMWLRIAFLYSSQYCVKNLKIYLYCTPFKKQIPLELMEVLGPEHCNSAVTTSCPLDGAIVVYRKEEWFKVFIHESFHTLGLDFSTFSCQKLNAKLAKLFPIKSEINAFEAYSEFWATIINCLFCAYDLLDDKLNDKDFLLYSDFCIQFERIFALFQMVKILNFMGVSYQHLFEKNEISDVARRYLYKENTNVFSYYIIKCILLYNYDAFLKWCEKNNINTLRFDRYDNNMNKFYSFIESHYNNPLFLADYRKMRTFYIKNKSNKQMARLFDTMRMTICELD